MKKLLIASAAGAALAFAAPAFAQVSVDETVQGTVTTPNVSTPAPSVSDATQPVTGPQSVTGEATANATAPVETAQTDAQATVTAPNAQPTVSAAANAADETAQTASTTAQGADATVTAEANASADAPTQTAQADASVQADLPQQVQVAVADGRYTTDDLNRAQLEALRGSTGR